MPKDTRDKNIVTTLAAILITMTVLIGFVAVILQQMNSKKLVEEANLAAATLQQEAPPLLQSSPPEGRSMIAFHKPEQMRGVFVEAGTDFLSELSYPLQQAAKSETNPNQWQSPEQTSDLSVSEEQANAEINKMLLRAKELGMNTVFVKTNTLLGSLHQIDSVHALTSNYDAMAQLLKQAREKDLYLYAVYDISLLPNGDQLKRFSNIDQQVIQSASRLLSDFAQKYPVDGILLDGYQNQLDEMSYAQYAQFGGGISFAEYMQENTTALVREAAEIVHQANPQIQLGLAADAAWALDAKKQSEAPLAPSDQIDFLGVKTDYAAGTEEGLFESTLDWWDSLCGEVNLPGYLIHAANKAVTWQDGWGARDQLAKQFYAVQNAQYLEGSIFNSLRSLRNNPNGTATALTEAIEKADADSLDPKENASSEEANSAEAQPVALLQGGGTYFGEMEALAKKKMIVKKKPRPSGSSNNTNSNNSSNNNSPNSGTSNAPIQNGTLVKVVAEQAITFPATNSSIYPDEDCYPLPQGTMDYVTGDQVVTKVTSNSGTEYRKYYKLRSGRRVYIEDVKAASGNNRLEGNRISDITVKANQNYTYLILKSDLPVSFLPNYSDRMFSIDFQYTDSTPGDLRLSRNPLFDFAQWSGSRLMLGLKTNGGFLGYKAYHENGNIVFRFNNPTPISGSRIVVDPGHGGSDPGAEKGLKPGYPEKEVNWELSQAITKSLEARGSNVLLLKTVNKTTSMDERLAQARNFNAQIYLSIHTNSSESNASAQGSESYYFFPFAKDLANRITRATSTGLNTGNRGVQFDVFYVTRDPQFVGVLSECGFLTTPREYAKLLDPAYQSDVGKQIALSIEEYLNSCGANYAGITGTESLGTELYASDGPTSSGISSAENGSSNSNSSGTSGVTSLILDRKEIDLAINAERRLSVTLRGDTSAPIRYTSSDTSIATVDSYGWIRGLKRGQAEISAVAGDQKGVCTVYVDNYNGGSSSGTESNTGLTRPVTGVRIRSSTTTLSVGESTTLSANIMPGDASNQRVVWDVSSGESKISIDQNGVLTGLRRGWGSIHVHTEDGYFSDEIEIQVK